MQLRVLNLYPDQMNIYADRGNLIFLSRRCEWRGIEFVAEGCGLGEGFDPSGYDLIYVGGGQDRDQELVGLDLLETKHDAIQAAFADGVVILAVCGGYQLLGNRWETDTGIHQGLGLVEMETVRTGGDRLIGPVLIETDFGGQTMQVAGFENHGGRTYLGPDAVPFGRVLRGHGNNGSDGLEGVMTANMVGTYLHGPLLPKNHLLADRLIEAALGARYSIEPELVALDDEAEERAHAIAVQAALTAR